jgi:hypothetical protein
MKANVNGENMYQWQKWLISNQWRIGNNVAIMAKIMASIWRSVMASMKCGGRRNG